MVTKSYKKILKSVAAVKSTKIVGSTDHLPLTYVSTNGGEYTFLKQDTNLLQLATFATSKTSTGICIGSGTTPATENDYCLETYYTSNELALAIDSTDIFIDNETGGYGVKVGLSISNKTNSELSISEIGVQCSGNSSSLYNAAYRFYLAERTVLDTPVTLGPDDPIRLLYTIICDWDI